MHQLPPRGPGKRLAVHQRREVAAGRGDNRAGPANLNALDPHFRDGVLGGWRLFQTSMANDEVACVHCHPDHEQIRYWAPAYPKVEVFDGTVHEVKVLPQVVSDALEKHSDLERERHPEVVRDLVAYISWWGSGLPLNPGHSRPHPPPAEDLRLLSMAVSRGKALFLEGEDIRCIDCHAASETDDKLSIGDSAAGFPRYVGEAGQVLSLSSFLTRHLQDLHSKERPPDRRTVTDLTAYLASLAKGKEYHPGEPPGEKR